LIRPGSSHPPYAVVLPFEILPFETVAPELPHRPQKVDGRSLPLYVSPLPEESLFSWLQRLATRLEVSFHTLASQTFGIDDRAGRTVWWHRPHPWNLARISQRTGVKIPRLRSMTFEPLQPAYREDEDAARFAGRRYDTRAPDWRAFRFVVCGPCLEGDSAPYLRSLWQIGWLAVCPIHGTVLLRRCERCHAGIRVSQFATCVPFSPTTCNRCGEGLLADRYRMAHPAVVSLQGVLLEGKRSGVTEIAGLGTFSYQEVVALADTLLGAFWTSTTLEERTAVLTRYEYESLEDPRLEMQVYECRHDSLRFLAWLMEDWPDGPGGSIGRDMLWRALNGHRNRLSHHVTPRWKGHPWSPSPHDFAPEAVARLRKLLEM
jgi:hypothetical protein